MDVKGPVCHFTFLQAFARMEFVRQYIIQPKTVKHVLFFPGCICQCKPHVSSVCLIETLPERSSPLGKSYQICLHVCST